MSSVRALIGTRKGAFILTADGKREKWSVSGPHFAGWEMYHLKGSPADPNRIYASQSSGWFGQLIQRSIQIQQFDLLAADAAFDIDAGGPLNGRLGLAGTLFSRAGPGVIH